MTKERIEEIAGTLIERMQVNFSCATIEKFISALPEFQEPHWIKIEHCLPSNMPVYRTPIYLWNDVDKKTLESFSMGPQVECNAAITHWQPRHVPAPPVEEDSPLGAGRSGARHMVKDRTDIGVKSDAVKGTNEKKTNLESHE